MEVVKTGANFIGGTAEHTIKDGAKGLIWGAVGMGIFGAVLAGGAALAAFSVLAVFVPNLLAAGAVWGAIGVASFLGGIFGAKGGALTGGTIGAGVGLIRGGVKKVGEMEPAQHPDLTPQIEALRKDNMERLSAMSKSNPADAQSIANLNTALNQADATSRAANYQFPDNPDAKAGFLSKVSSEPKPEVGQGMVKG